MKYLTCILSIIILLLLSSCASTKEFYKRLLTNDEYVEESSEVDANVFEIKDYHIRFSLPEDWEKIIDTPYDLQCNNKNAYFSVFAYQAIDLAEDQTPLDIYLAQKDDLFFDRDNVKVVDYEGEFSSEDKIISTELISAELDGMKNYYYCCLVEFNDHPDTFAWIVFTSIPSYMVANMDILNNIIASAEYIE